MTIDLRDGTTVEDARLDRLVEFDDASRSYPVTAVITATAPVSKAWDIPAGEPVLDQGREGACVGFGVTNELRFNPVPVAGLDATFARERIYWPAQRIDQWAGGAYPGANPFYEGTSVLAGIKTAAAAGHYGEYRWAFGEEDLALAVAHVGPAVIGVNWYQGMFRPDYRGYLNATGKIQGGHCVLVCGIKVTRPFGAGYYTIYNSWGPTWGGRAGMAPGTARIRRSTMDRLLREDGEACLITQRLTPTR